MIIFNLTASIITMMLSVLCGLHGGRFLLIAIFGYAGAIIAAFTTAAISAEEDESLIHDLLDYYDSPDYRIYKAELNRLAKSL